MIIGVSGKMQSGKDTFFKIMSSIQPGMDWRNKKFAGKLKQVASIITGVPEASWDDHEFKSRMMPGDWGMTYRDFLQRLGTEAIRNVMHSNAWVYALMADYKKTKKMVDKEVKKEGNIIITTYDEVEEYPNWIITDIRFPNEAEIVRQMGCPLVRVNRFDSASNHPSETALDSYGRFDFVISNTGSLQDFDESVRRIANIISAKI